MISIAGDHDVNIISLTPSVTLRVEVKPDKGEDGTSYYRGEHLLLLSFHVHFSNFPYIKFVFILSFIGEANVTVKDSIFQGSTRLTGTFLYRLTIGLREIKLGLIFSNT